MSTTDIASSQRSKILVVEDDKALNKAIVLKLKKHGYSIVSVFNAEDGLAALREQQDIKLIWLDVLLPGMNGFSFLELVKSDPELREKKVVIVSVSGGREASEKARAMGAADYLLKSAYDLDELIAKVVVHLRPQQHSKF